MPTDKERKALEKAYAEAQAKLPEARERQWMQGWETFRRADPTVHQAEVDRYNALAARTRKANPAGRAGALEADDLGRTFVRLPDATPLAKLPAVRPFGPLPPVTAPQAVVATQPGADERVVRHEREHVQAVQPDERGFVTAKRPPPPGLDSITPEWLAQERAYWNGQRRAAYEQLSPRERELWRVYKTLRNDESPHEMHVAYGVDALAAPATEGARNLQQKRAAIAERAAADQAALSALDARLGKAAAPADLKAKRAALASRLSVDKAALGELDLRLKASAKPPKR